MLTVPADLNRNADDVTVEGHDASAKRLMREICDRTGLSDFLDTDVLDVGCGVRFTAAIVNLELGIKSYTGVEVHKPIVDFLTEEADDARFSFAHWDVQNDLYNSAGVPLASCDKLPVSKKYDQIWLMSVFTHTKPEDMAAMLSLFKKCIKEEGKLVFTCFVDPALETFNNADGRLIYANYGESFLEGKLSDAGWTVDAWYPPTIQGGSHWQQGRYGRMYICSNFTASKNLHKGL
jgi:SAM-dependent methyltransferase